MRRTHSCLAPILILAALPCRGAEPGPRPLPTPRQAGVLGNYTNTGPGRSWYVEPFPERFASTPIITDLEATTPRTPESEKFYRAALDAIRKVNPTAIIGTYLSATLV